MDCPSTQLVRRLFSWALFISSLDFLLVGTILSFLIFIAVLGKFLGIRAETLTVSRRGGAILVEFLEHLGFCLFWLPANL